jgi:hypothetical protein
MGVHALSNLVVGLLLAVVVAGVVGYAVYYAGSQASRVPSTASTPCRVLVEAVQNGTSYLVYTVYQGSGSSPPVHLVSASFSGSPSIAWQYYPVSSTPSWTNSYTGFEQFFSTSNPTASGSTSSVYYSSSSQEPYVSGLPSGTYFAMAFTTAVAPFSSGMHNFTLQCNGACDMVLIDTLTGGVSLLVGLYGPASSTQVASNYTVAPLYAGRVYTITVRQASQTPGSVLYAYIDGNPLNTTSLQSFSYGISTQVITIQPQQPGVVYAMTLQAVPLYYTCKGSVYTVER